MTTLARRRIGRERADPALRLWPTPAALKLARKRRPLTVGEVWAWNRTPPASGR